MLEEQWVPLLGYPNYEVSNYGRVTNVRTGRDLRPYPDKRTGILRVAVYNNGSRKDVQLKRLVAECYFLNYRKGSEVNQKNGDKTDCSVLNLTLGHVDFIESSAQYLSNLEDGDSITISDLTKKQITQIVDRARDIRKIRDRGRQYQ